MDPPWRGRRDPEFYLKPAGPVGKLVDEQACGEERDSSNRVKPKEEETGNLPAHVDALRLKPMLVQDLGRDLRIGLRILVKEKAFSAPGRDPRLALWHRRPSATMFSVVNGIMPARLPPSPKRRPAGQRQFSWDTGQRHLLRVSNGTRGPRWTSKRLRARSRKSFELLAAYLSGSTVNLNRRRTGPSATPGAYVTEDFPGAALGVVPDDGPGP